MAVTRKNHKDCPVDKPIVTYLLELIDDDVTLTKSLTEDEYKAAVGLHGRLRQLNGFLTGKAESGWANLRMSANQAVYLYELVNFDLDDDEIEPELTDAEIRNGDKFCDRLEAVIRNFIKDGYLVNGACDVWTKVEKKAS